MIWAESRDRNSALSSMSNVRRHFKLKGVMVPMILRDRSAHAIADSRHRPLDPLNHFAKELNQFLKTGGFTH
ncbi:hypothetical protein BN77_3670 [Rhizobium mesoamericanum STM3625]|uniref:Uncharacterized protein n=1 Tax=Rhizobium mesoamericanum STM3625 TaxID=1211777 RepID=K0PJK0_9HYPH|nr:hypothetical protein BN77_3670 [Rhizobium mesoamericanum STM3625]